MVPIGGRASAFPGGAVTQHCCPPAFHPAPACSDIYCAGHSSLSTCQIHLGTQQLLCGDLEKEAAGTGLGDCDLRPFSGKGQKSLPRVPVGPCLRVCRDWQEQTRVGVHTPLLLASWSPWLTGQRGPPGLPGQDPPTLFPCSSSKEWVPTLLFRPSVSSSDPPGLYFRN